MVTSFSLNIVSFSSFLQNGQSTSEKTAILRLPSPRSSLIAFLKVYLEGNDNEDEEKAGMLPNLTKGEQIDYNFINATQRFTSPPYRFTEASLVKQLEELGIGRPSTYAPTISTVQRRLYFSCETKI